jgi:competence protein ComEA
MSPNSIPQRLRAHVSAALDWYGPARALATAGSVVAVCIGAWWLLRAPSPPLEASLPFAGASNVASSVIADVPMATLALPGVVPEALSSAARDITVHVIGAVVAPGVYTLAASSRVVDAVEAAGGATAQADLSSLNMALPLADADQVYVPPRSVSTPRPSPPTSRPRRTNPTVVTVPQAIASATSFPMPTGSTQPPLAPTSTSVNINTADVALLETLPGVGPSTAKAIVAHRQANGPFGKPEDLLDVRGIGDGKFAEMKRFVTVS